MKNWAPKWPKMCAGFGWAKGEKCQKNLDDSFNNVITKCQDCVDHREELNDLNLITCKAMGWNKKDWFEIVKK